MPVKNCDANCVLVLYLWLDLRCTVHVDCAGGRISSELSTVAVVKERTGANVCLRLRIHLSGTVYFYSTRE